MEVTTRLTWNEERSLQKLLGNVSLTLLYKSTVHGCSTEDADQRCTDQGSILIMIYLSDAIFGVFMLGNYPKLNNSGKPNSSFCFSLTEKNNIIETSFLKVNFVPKISGKEPVIFSLDSDTFSIVPDKSTHNIQFNLKEKLRVANSSRATYLECEIFRVEGIMVDPSYIPRIMRVTPHRNKLLSELRAYKPHADMVSKIRILLLGPVGSGKSSFFNSVKSIFQGHVTRQAIVGSDSTSITEQYRTYSVKDGKYGTFLPFVLCDSMGLDETEGEGLCMDDIPHILRGHVPDRYQFNPHKPITPKHPNFITSPSLKDRIHCVAYVLDINSINNLSSKMVAKLKQVHKEVLNCGLAHVALLTKVSNCNEVLQDSFLNMNTSMTSQSQIESMAVTTNLTWWQKKILQNHFGEKRLSLLYKASVHTFSRHHLLGRCSNQGPTITVIYGDNCVTGVYVQESYQEQEEISSVIIFALKETKILEYKIRSYDSLLFGSQFMSRNDDFCINLHNQKLSIPSDVRKKLRLPQDHISIQECEVFRCEDLLDERNIKKIIELRNCLLSDLKAYKPYGDLIQEIRILLLGPTGAGKSSFFNSVKSIYQGYVTHQALVGTDTAGISQKYRTYSIREKKDGNALPFILCDSMGLGENEGGLCMNDIVNILKGHIPDRYENNSLKPITSNHPNYIDSPLLKDRIHCVAFVFDANSIEHLSEEMVAKIKRTRREVIKCGVMHIALLTHVDTMNLITKGDLIDIYRCMPVKIKLNQVNRKLGFALSDILVVSNYTSEWSLDPVKDVLILSALRQMLWTADDFLEDLPLQ
ncbi:interferon-induced protein 44 isoform X1 [Tupaia chinensis]|nr:interferon-induced protein 44 isoform X1 [Tupaia chinensis]XP_027626680.1 interferon-induced protein 44 isoform X1 [Tupaia chinensis]